MGAYGGANVGDEVILLGARKLSEQLGYDPQIRVIGTVRPVGFTDREAQASEMHEFTTIHSPIKGIRFAAFRDLLIGGGQVIDGSAGPKLGLAQLGLALVSALTGGRVYIVGAGAFRISRPDVRLIYSTLLRMSKVVIVRDIYSYDLLAELNPRSSALMLGADVVFTIQNKRPHQNVSKEIVLGVHNAPHVVYSAATEVQALVRRLLDTDPEATVTVVAHDRRPEFDRSLATQIVEAINNPRVRYREFESPEECLRYYQGVRTVISHRMHPLIIASISGAHAVGLAGSEKVSAVSSRLGLPVFSTDELLSMDTPAFEDVIFPADGVVDDQCRRAEELGRLLTEALRTAGVSSSPPQRH